VIAVSRFGSIIVRIRLTIVIGLASILAASTVRAQPAAVYGAASPQDVVAGIQKASKTQDWSAATALLSPAGRQMLVTMLIQPLVMAVRFSDPSSPMPGTPPLSKAELAAKQKSHKAMVELVTRTLKPAGLESIVGKAPMNPEVQKAIDAALPKADTIALIPALLETTKQVGTLMGVAPDLGLPLPPLGNVTGYKVTGEKATAKEGTSTLDFIRINGRWYFTPPEGK
jgi:hypothetical protein